MRFVRLIVIAGVVLAAGSVPTRAQAPTAFASGPPGAMRIDGGRVGGEPWKLVAYSNGGERCLDVLFRGDPCRGCGSKVPGAAQVEFRRHTYLDGRQLTFVVVETSRRVERIKLSVAGERPLALRVRDPFGSGPRPPGVPNDFRFAIASFEGNALVRSVAGFNRHGRLVQRRTEPGT